jgi:glycosyltransferase involved in cell wall biosynthesis
VETLLRTLQIGEGWSEERITGLTRYFSELTHYLPSTGTAVQCLVVGARDILKQTQGVVIPFARPQDPLFKRLYNVRQVAQALTKQRQIELVACHFALYAAPMGAEVKKLPLVIHFHGPWAAESDVEGATARTSQLKFAIERSVYRRARRLIVLSHSFQEELVSGYGVDEDLTRVIPGGIDTERFNVSNTRSQARQRLGWPEDRPILLTVRRQVRRMGLENLIDAMEQVRASCPDALLLLGGTGAISNELQLRVKERGLEQNVRLLGRVSEIDLPLAYRAADITVVPSQSLEGFGLVTLESLASGTPALVTPIGGLPEVIQPLAPQCIFAESSTSAMASLLREVLRGSVQLPSEGDCRRYASENYAWPRVAERVRTIYDEAIG